MTKEQLDYIRKAIADAIEVIGNYNMLPKAKRIVEEEMGKA